MYFKIKRFSSRIVFDCEGYYFKFYSYSYFRDKFFTGGCNTCSLNIAIESGTNFIQFDLPLETRNLVFQKFSRFLKISFYFYNDVFFHARIFSS